MTGAYLGNDVRGTPYRTLFDSKDGGTFELWWNRFVNKYLFLVNWE